MCGDIDRGGGNVGDNIDIGASDNGVCWRQCGNVGDNIHIGVGDNDVLLVCYRQCLVLQYSTPNASLTSDAHACNSELQILTSDMC